MVPFASKKYVLADVAQSNLVRWSKFFGKRKKFLQKNKSKIQVGVEFV